ncbi:NUDIX domain-containing protein [Dactylosporangium sp. CA-152071]|uniref:NUDIX domain-containing protein n=1 Tax=Dactylosporangium sp. CA-152071 TaxID=3239933 RepID=UPI003D8F1B36
MTAAEAAAACIQGNSPHFPVLVVVRGNSGSGKSTIAREVRARYGRGCALIEQDEHRRIVLREHEHPDFDPVAPQFIADTVLSALRLGYHVVLEGILSAVHHGAVLRQPVAEHPGPSHVFYLDIPLAETLRRHQARAAAPGYTVGFTAADMTGWYHERDVLGVAGEHVIGADSTLEDTVTTILHRSALTAAAPLAPCPVTCPRCAEKAAAPAPHPAEGLAVGGGPAPAGQTAAPLVVAALAIVPAGDGQVVFVRQQRGPYAGSLLLPGGKVEPGEAFEDAARREAREEAGVDVDALTPTGVYDISGHGPDGAGYRFLMFAFLAHSGAVRVGAGGHHVDAVVLAEPSRVRPHPTVRRILNDAGVAANDPADFERELQDAGVVMRVYPISQIGATEC